MAPDPPPNRRASYERLVRRVLASSPPRALRWNREGHVNFILEVDRSLIFRFPRTRWAAGKLAMELQLLPLVSRHLRIPIPEPCFLGCVPGPARWPFMGYRRLPGKAVDWRRLRGPGRRALLRGVGEILDDLAKVPCRAAAQCGVPGEAADYWHDTMTREHRNLRSHAFPLLPPTLREGLDATFRCWLNDLEHPRYRPVLLHGEIKPNHLLWDRGRPSGLLDWGQVRIGDPAFEFAHWAAWMGTAEVPRLARSRTAPRDRTFDSRVEFYRLLPFLWAIGNRASIGDLAAARARIGPLRRAWAESPFAARSGAWESPSGA